ncbi:hypothetical protein V1477_000197 [Vespula maculifrons]|uniref:Uncharacterized protein n=1 Tax=Vespula maculifrons TaxID=7453 RepID=A0ABD2D278_VESMC
MLEITGNHYEHRRNLNNTNLRDCCDELYHKSNENVNNQVARCESFADRCPRCQFGERSSCSCVL